MFFLFLRKKLSVVILGCIHNINYLTNKPLSQVFSSEEKAANRQGGHAETSLFSLVCFLYLLVLHQQILGHSSRTHWYHLVSVWIGAHWIFSSQCNAAGHDHEEDGHLKVAQSHHIVTNPPDAADEQSRRCKALLHFYHEQRFYGFCSILRVGGLEDEHAIWCRSYTFGRSWRLLVFCFLISLVTVVCLQLFIVH